jgi:glycosyltransferase involved in cell wall biosynthesis
MSMVVLIIPAYNESMAIADVVKRATQHIAHVIIVDDGSTDNTADIVHALPVTLIRNEKNLGKGEALIRGFVAALALGATHVITMDGDGQHNPHDLPRLVQAIEKAPKAVVIAARLGNTQAAPKGRLMANRVADFFISWAAGQRVYDTQSGFRVYPAHLLTLFQKHYSQCQSFVFESEIILKAAQCRLPIAAIAIDSLYPKSARHSHFQPARDIWEITRMVSVHLAKKWFNISGLVKVIFSKGKLLGV